MDLVETRAGHARRHPWELARFHFFHRVLGPAWLAAAPRSVLDIGAGDGWFSESLGDHLAADSRMVCWDANYTDEHLKPFGGAQVDRLTFTREAPDGRYDLVLLMDVLEHIEDDRGFLAETAGRYPHGDARILISVPAWPFLFSRHDAFVRHCRRYTPRQARALIEGAGLRIRQGGGLFHGLLPLRALAVARERVLGDDRPVKGLGGWSAGPRVTAAVTGVLQTEGALSRWFAMAGLEVPGLSWWALCERPRW